MKTFDEALISISRPRSDNQRPSLTTVDMLGLESRYGGIIDEARASSYTHSLMYACITALTSGEMKLDRVIFTAFINGLLVGIEMEKAE